MKKMFAVFGMILFIYTTMSIFSGELNPILWINQNNEIKNGLLFLAEILFFCIACLFLYTDD